MGDDALIRAHKPFPKERIYNLRLLITVISFLFLVLALADFTKTAKEETESQNGRDIVVLLDVSKSMLAKDVMPNRLEASKEVVKELLLRYPDDRFGLMFFAGNPYFACPLTNDLGSVLMFLNAATPSAVPSQGSSLEAALLKVEEAFLKEEKRQQILILLTDGEDHAENTLKAAESLSQKGINLMVVGCGTINGSAIFEEETKTPKKDKEGKIILTRLDPILLTNIAAEAGGAYFGYAGKSETVKQLTRKMEELQKKGGLPVYNPAKRTHYFQWFLSVAILLLMIDLFLFTGRQQIIGLWMKNSHKKQEDGVCQ